MSGSAQHPDQAPMAREERSRALRQPFCERCGARLSGRKRRFCSRRCCSEWWDAQHPRVNRGPSGPREGTITGALLGVMSDGVPRTAVELAELVRAFPHSVSARLSELRRKGFKIESDAKVGNVTRAHRFRLVL